MGEEGKDSVPKVYESRPPSWLPKAHTSADLGYPGFYPPRPGQDEDALSPTTVKTGFILSPSIPAESFSAQDTIHNRFVTGNALTELEELMNQVFTRRTEQLISIPPSSFRMPSRVTLNDAKRHAWFADLANPDVPLYKLGKNVPHGAKGHDLLDLLHANKVAIPRAVWFLRVFGANETAGLRNKPSYNPTQYSIEWANVMTGYMKKQLADIVLPSAPRLALNIRQIFKGVLADPDSRDRWISRFTYCLQLLRSFYAEGLVDNTTFLVWLVQQMQSCNLAQVAFLARLADEYLDGMLGCRALVKPFVDACLTKLSEIHLTSAQEFLLDTQSLLEVVLQRICLAFPNAFVSPRMWTTHCTLLERILTREFAKIVSDRQLEQNIREIHQTLQGDFVDIKTRNEAMLFYNLPTQVMAHVGEAVLDIQLLNSISNGTDLETITYFDSADSSRAFVCKLDVLLTWSVTPLQYGDHRPYACVTLLRSWHGKAVKRALRHDSTPPKELIQDRVFYWLDTSDVAGEFRNIRSVALLMENLIQNDLFSYTNYIQRLIARGEPGLLYSDEIGSRHRMFMCWMPLQRSTSLISQRKMTLHGPRARETPEDITERDIRKEIRAVIPELFEGILELSPNSRKSLMDLCPALVSATRFEQVNTFRQWLLPILRKALTSQAQDAVSQPTLVRIYNISVELMDIAQCFDCILDLSLLALCNATTMDLLTSVIQAIQQYHLIWTSKNAMSIITATFFSAHQNWRTRRLRSRGLLVFLMDTDNNRFLDTTSREQIFSDMSAYTHALQPETDYPTPVPAVLPEILLLASDPDPEASSILANGSWYKYRAGSDWGWKVWDNTVASLRQIPVLIPDTTGRRACALRYAKFLLHVDEHLPTGFDDQVLGWFLGPGRGEIMALNADAWDVFTVVILYLSVHGALKMTTILTGLIYPAWQLGATASGGLQGQQSLEIFLRAANLLFELLLLREDSNCDDMPPTDLLDFRRLRARRQEVFYEPHFPLLVTNIPTLVAMEKNGNVADDIRSTSMSLRISLCADRGFCQGAHRNLDAVKQAFEQPLQSDAIGDELRESLIEALCLVLWETREDIPNSWQNLASLLSPWRLGATTIVLQSILKHMGKELSQENNNKAVNSRLDELTLSIFRQTMTTKEAYFVAQMTRDVGGHVVGKFVNNGLRCITDLLDSVPYLQIHSLSECIQQPGEVLRVLTHLTEPLRIDASKLPIIESNIQDGCFNAICRKFTDIETMLSSGDTQWALDVQAMMSNVIIFLARLLQFDLGLRGIWTNNTKTAVGNLTSTLFKLAIIHGAGIHLNTVVFPLLVDTLCYLLDEIPPDAKTATFEPFRNYPAASKSDLPIDMPLEYRTQLQYLLPHSVTNATVANLMSAYRDATGALVPSGLLVNRPWEWVENLGEPATLDPKEEAKELEEKERLKTRYLVKNSGSLSLDAFLARVTGDGIISGYEDSRVEGNIRSFEDGLSAESVFKRDWRETRVSLEVGNLPRARSEDGGSHSSTGQVRVEKRPRTSPASSALSRSSEQMPASGSSMSRTSPGNRAASSSGASEPMDVDAFVAASEKRKSDVISDDEVEIVEGPVRTTTAKPKPKFRPKKR